MINLKFKTNQAITTLFFVSIFLIPFDSFPLFPISSVYRPISFFPLIMAFVLMLSLIRLSRFSLLVIFGSSFVLLYSIILSVIFFDELSHINKTLITLVLFIIMLSVYHKVIKYNLQNNQQEFLHRLGKWAFYSFIFISFIGFIQFCMKLGIIPQAISEQITLLFSYRTVNRIQMVSGEPSMMIRNILLLGTLIYFFYYGKYRRIVLTLVVFFLLISGSTFGYLTIFLLIAVYMILFKPKMLFNIKALLGVLLLVFSLSILMTVFLDSYTLGKINIVLKIFSNLDLDTLMAVIQSDGSAFQRIMNPVIGFMSGDSTNYLGSGIDGYRYLYPYYINEYFPFALDYSTVNSAVSGDSYITPKSLYSKIYSELGIVPFILFISYLTYLYIAIIKLKDKVYLPFLFSLAIVYILNTDSIIYLNYFLILVFIHLSLNYLYKTELPIKLQKTADDKIKGEN